MARHGGSRPVKYRQIAADLRARIERGEWPVDAQMPTLPELAAQYDAAPGTVVKALDVLYGLGIAETLQGMGTFVREPKPERAEYDVVMERVDALAEEIRLLRERVAAVERQEAASG